MLVGCGAARSGGAARPVADDAAEGPVAAGGDVASPLSDDGGRGAAGAAGSLAGDGAEEGAVATGSAAELLAAGVGGGGSVWPVAEDAGPVRPVAEAASADNAAKDSQTGQTLPVKGRIAGTTRSTMPA